MTTNFFIAILLILCIGGICGLFLHQKKQHKIASLSISYTSFLVAIALLFFNNKSFSEITAILINLMIVFASSIFIGSRLLRNSDKKIIDKINKNEESN